ncbi:extracellular solute-binding protein [Treponema vincentii]|uniref:ABC transporter substrate-binding protein n=1 Tax=Treponema TaxID=157 RepID=UPI001BB006AA|nr:extracellular solute-binding protein [Treponema vincentii]QUY18561.1 extracellular solute-binding protein [Treponema vincentii]
MKKSIALLLVCLCSVAFVFAMGQGDNSKADPNAPVTLSVYMQMDLANPQSAYWPETVAAFEKKYPNIKLEFEYVSGEAFHDKFQIMAASGDIPDVFTTYAGARSGYVLDRGMVKDLRPYLTDDLKKQYNSTVWAPQGPNGEIYIISQNLAVCTVVYINPKLQKKLGLTTPKTLDEMIAQVPTIRAAGLTPLAFANKGQWQAQSLLLSMLTDRMAGTAWFDKAMVGKAKFSDKQFVDAINVIKTMTDSKLFPPGVNQMEGTASWGEFIADKAVYLLDAGWRISALKNAAKPEDYAQYQLMAFPAIAGEVTHGSSAATIGEAFGMNAKLTGAKADAAWKFISFMSGKEACEILTKYGTTTTYKLDLSKFDIDQLTKQYIDLINNQSMGYVIDAKMDSEGVNSLLNPGIQAVMIGQKTPAQLANEYEAWVAANDSHRKK